MVIPCASSNYNFFGLFLEELCPFFNLEIFVCMTMWFPIIRAFNYLWIQMKFGIHIYDVNIWCKFELRRFGVIYGGVFYIILYARQY